MTFVSWGQVLGTSRTPLRVCVCVQLYTVSQDGTLCVWESDTQLDGLILDKDRTALTPRDGDGEGEGEGEVIRGTPDPPKGQGRKTVRYKQVSK